MDSIILNKKKYKNSGIFKNGFIEEYCNLNIYPLVGILEREAGLLSDIDEACTCENIQTGYTICGDNERTDFIKDNLLNFTHGNFITYIDESIIDESIIDESIIDEYIKNIEILKLSDFVLTIPNEFMDTQFKKINIHEMKKVLYISEKYLQIFQKYFHFYFENEIFYYDNLICYTMIVKNAGPILEKVLIDNLPIIDRWCILDTGSTDGTQEVIKRVLKNKKGILHEEPFVNFKVSRNRCLELAGKSCKYKIMLDDTYSIKGNLRSFLHTVRGDQFGDSFSLLIQSEDTEYYSNRIIKSTTGLQYIHTIHEVITDENNINVTIPVNQAIIFDNRTEYMEKRTMDRKQFDLELLFKEVEDDPDDPRALYYIAQTYGCIGDEINKAKYFELRIEHPVLGYYQEKIDACFELARCYNFKISAITKQPFTKPITEDEWKRCEELYLKAYYLDVSRPDSLYFIGIHYYLHGDFQIAFTYFKKAFEVGYPLNSQYSLKPTLSFHFLPKFLTELCYYFKEYKLGLDAANLFLTSTKFNNPGLDSWNLMTNWYKIHENMCKMPNVSEKPSILDKPIIGIVTDGGWEPWTGKDIETKGLGGSETWIVEMAKYISRTNKFHVVVFCKTNQPEFYENVGYNPIELFHQFIATTQVEHLIVSRYTEYVPVAINGHAKNISIIFHDNLSPELILPSHDKIKNILGLSQWHSNQIRETFPQFENKIKYINYGVDSSNIPENPVKTKNKFIYSSFPNRGLVILLKMWPKIVKEFPDATLDIFCNVEQEWVNTVVPDMMREIKTLLKINKKGIKNFGWVSKKVLAEHYQNAEYWLYPCIFEETFCLTALEAAISNTCVITNGLAALEETAKYGYTIQGNPTNEEWQTKCLTTLFEIMKNGYKTTETNYTFAKKLTWESQAMKLLEILK